MRVGVVVFVRDQVFATREDYAFAVVAPAVYVIEEIVVYLVAIFGDWSGVGRDNTVEK